MKVTMMTREYPPYVYGGAGVHVRYLSQELSKLMAVEIRCIGDQDITSHQLRVRGYMPRDALQSGQQFAPALETLSVNLLSVGDSVDSDLVHTHTWYGHFAGFLIKTLYGIPLVATCHSLEPVRPWKEDHLGRGYHLSSWTEKVGIENADRVIAVSQSMKEDILKYFSVPEERVVVIHNGIDLDTWQPTPLSDELKAEYGIEDDYVLFVGRPTPQKGMEYLVEAADQIPVQLVFAAVGSDTKEYEERMIEQVQTKRNILWIHKLLKEEEYVQLYSGARAFVCPSVYEPFGIINLEAMACQVPVVASAVGGILEVVLPEQTGILVEPRDPDQIAAAVKRLLGDRELSRQLGERGRARVEERFSWSAIAKQTKALYASVLHRELTPEPPRAT
jgi:starch synthase